MTAPMTLDQLIASVTAQASAESDLDLLTIAVSISDQVGALADALVGHFVERARSRGNSWAQIGTALGVSKQAVQQRFVSHWASPGTPWSPEFSRFTGRARHALLSAETAARAAGHNFVGTEHVLLGTIGVEGGLAAAALEAMGVPVAQVSAAMTARMPQGAASPPGTPLPLTPRAKAALEQAVQEAIDLGHNYVGTEHLLLGLTRVGTGLAAEVLAEQNVAVDTLRAKVIELLSGFKSAPES